MSDRTTDAEKRAEAILAAAEFAARTSNYGELRPHILDAIAATLPGDISELNAADFASERKTLSVLAEKFPTVPVAYTAEAFNEFVTKAEAAALPQWQPIDGAPKDGTRVIISDGEGSVVGLYMDGSWLVEWNHDKFDPGGQPATHYMLLQPPPAEPPK